MKDRSKLARWLSSSTRFANMGLFDDAAAGLVVSGDSGSGKSYFLNTIGRWLIEQRRGMTLIDPHGDLVDELERFCSTLPPSQRRRVIVIRYADTTRITGLNPLHVPRQGLSEIAFRAMLAGRTGHVARILLHAFGETFNGKPNMLRFFHYYLMTLAHAGLTIPDVRYFFDMKHPIYRALIKAAPDYIARLELAQLIDLKPADRDELIGSTKNRFLNFLQNPLVELALGMPDGHLDVAQAIRDGAVILISLARGSVLRDEDVEIFANLWLEEILFHVFNVPRHERTPHVLLLDELPTFRSSYQLITRALAQVRKFLCPIVAAFQGTQLFQERERDPLLNALIGQCNVQLYFRHKHPIDARFFGDLIKLPSISSRKVKHILWQRQAYQDGKPDRGFARRVIQRE